jgi:3-phenylpropionate/cinnamic acid dioxygenase small subunit
MKTTMLAALAAVSLFTGGAVLAADAPDARLLQEMKDRTEIEALMWRYVRALDTLDAEAYAAVYTEDGTFGSGQNQEKGRAELSKMITDLKKSRAEREAKGEPKSPPMYHTIFNHTIEFKDRDHATYQSYWATMFAASGQQTPARVAAVGRGVDELVRVNGQWLIKTRDVAPKD